MMTLGFLIPNRNPYSARAASSNSPRWMDSSKVSSADLQFRVERDAAAGRSSFSSIGGRRSLTADLFLFHQCTA
jgi:hypothetical protein